MPLLQPALKGRYNWAAAFAAFCQGSNLETIAQSLAIPEFKLVERANIEGWTRIAAKLQTHTPLTIAPPTSKQQQELEAKLEVLRINRAQNYKVACDLRDDLVEVVQKLRAGTLRLEKQFHNRGSVVRCDVDPGIVDRVNLATYARSVMDMTYQALGDRTATAGAKDDSAGVASMNSSTPPPITIILPGCIQRPREERAVSDAQVGQVIDISDLSDSTDNQGLSEPAHTPPSALTSEKPVDKLCGQCLPQPFQTAPTAPKEDDDERRAFDQSTGG
jgi:hypothetical protein